LADTKFIDEWTNYPSAKLADHLKPFTPDWAEEISGISADTIKRIAKEFAKNQPGYARAYNGISNHINGAQNARCVVLLNIIVGNIDKPGGFCLMKNGGFGKVDPAPHLEEVLKEIGAPDAKFPIEEEFVEKYPLTKWKPEHLLPHVLEELDYPIGLYMLHQYNPVFANPDVGLWEKFLSDKEKVEFIVDFTPYMSETAASVVDLIIPDVSYLERLHVNAMPAVEQIPFIHLYQPVIKPLYESKSMYDTMLAIAKKVPGMEKYFDFETVEDFCKGLVESKWGVGAWDKLVEDGVLIGSKYDPATYKSFDELTDDEIAKMRQFNTFKKTVDLAKLKSEGAQIPAGDGVIKDKDGK
ncbi:MAG: molybdopterin-dependent oxidoreductase, partial [Actinobacteria bacterium]|nr:molybdopterin-dependent oxidoreductase [Actinomycetota bacterium]